MYLSSINGGTFFQPLFFQFPSVDEFVQNDKILNEQIMLGNAILFNPILTKEEANISFAFPNENWNKFPYGEKVLEKNQTENLRQNDFDFLELSAKYSDLHLFVRGGYVIPFYNILENEKILRTKNLERTLISFIINPDENGVAIGDVIYDNPDSHPKKVIENKQYLHVRVTFISRNNEILFDVVNKNEKYNNNDVNISDIVIYNQPEPDIYLTNKSNKNLRYLNDENIYTLKNDINVSIYYLNNNLYIKFLKPVDIRNLEKIRF